MTNLKEEVLAVHENTDFVRNYAGVTQLDEFRYTHGGSVQPDLEYHIHYTNDKKEVFMTGGIHTLSSKIIEKRGKKSLFSTYTDLKSTSKKAYPEKYTPKPTDSDYRIGIITRYFTQKANNLKGELYEISKDSYGNKNSLFRYFEIGWRITGLRTEVSRDNNAIILGNASVMGNESLVKILFPLQFYKAPKDSVDDISERLSRRK